MRSRRDKIEGIIEKVVNLNLDDDTYYEKDAEFNEDYEEEKEDGKEYYYVPKDSNEKPVERISNKDGRKRNEDGFKNNKHSNENKWGNFRNSERNKDENYEKNEGNDDTKSKKEIVFGKRPQLINRKKVFYCKFRMKGKLMMEKYIEINIVKNSRGHC